MVILIYYNKLIGGMTMKELPIGVFDSGVGGISVLAELIHKLPQEKYIYYGDSGNAPYGTRSLEEVRTLSIGVANKLVEQGIKAFVVACNTATSGAINELRDKLDIPVIGMEPAIKPAFEMKNGGKVAVMATPFTLREKKFNNLISQWAEPAEIVKLPCPGLVEIIERTGGKGDELDAYLSQLFSQIDLSVISSLVLGCTHYIFIKNAIAKLIGKNILIIDGNRGTANQVERILREQDILYDLNARSNSKTDIKIYNSSKSEVMIHLSKQLLERRLKDLGWQGMVQYAEPPKG